MFLVSILFNIGYISVKLHSVKLESPTVMEIQLIVHLAAILMDAGISVTVHQPLGLTLDRLSCVSLDCQVFRKILLHYTIGYECSSEIVIKA